MKFLAYFEPFFHQTLLPQDLERREQWTIEILKILVIISTIPVAFMIVAILGGYFTFYETYPIFVNLIALIIGWQFAKKGNWRWAGHIPPIICFALGLYGLNRAGVNNAPVLFFATAVILSGMLQGSRSSILFVLAGTLAFSIIVYENSSPYFIRYIASILIVFVSLSGLAIFQSYFFSRLYENLESHYYANLALEEEITLRRKTEEIQHLQESQLKRLTDHMTGMVEEIDLNGKYLYASPSHFSVLGYNAEELTNISAFSLIHPDDMQRVLTLIENNLTSREKHSAIYRIKHADGHYIWVESSGKILEREDSSEKTLVISSHNITQQKQAEENTNTSEMKFRSIIEAIPMGIHMYTVKDSSKLVFSGYNPSANTILGVDHEQFVGKVLEEAFPGLIGTEVPGRYLHVALTGVPWMGEQIAYSDGKIAGAFDVHAFLTEPGHMAAIFSDITEKYKAAEALRISEEKFSTAFQISPDSININRLTDGLYININQGFSKTMGFSLEDVLGKTSLELNIWVDPADRARLVEAIRRDGIIENLEAQFRAKDGRVLQGLMSARSIMINGEPCLLNITRDITERKLAEIRLQDAHYELEQAYEATLLGWARALDLREHETADHSRRVVEYTVRIASALGIEKDRLVDVQRGALLHDLGKVGVPDNILLKPGPLTDDEWIIMRQHPVNAYNLLKDIEYLRPALDIPYCHHEHWDGTGYPRGLKGESIPLVARIFTIVDVWDALLSNRPYRPPWEKAEVLKYIWEHSGSLFDPEIVHLFLEINTD